MSGFGIMVDLVDLVDLVDKMDATDRFIGPILTLPCESLIPYDIAGRL